ncbi:MAG: KpsF/GutQ family sugar-phosphate isomerase [Candidatus Riflebacteria bacterium]|nr:KpsF/GutQ family sugar-phosphate isomerase [Candidatus Riflebacteria bacterium]
MNLNNSQKKTHSTSLEVTSDVIQTSVQVARETLQLEAKAIDRAAERLDEKFASAIDLILSSKGRVIVCGMGKSGLVGRKISATLSSTGTPSFFLHPAEALHGDLGTVIEEDVLILLSNSGETDEILRLIPYLRRIGARIIAFTGNSTSNLSRMADVTLDCGVEREACRLNLAPTSSSTVTMAMGDALAMALLTRRGFKEKDFARLHPSGNLGKKFLSVKDLMHCEPKIPFAEPTISLREAIIKMTKGGFGALVFSDETNTLMGIFTDGDLRRYFERGESDLLTPVSSIMIRQPKTIGPEKLAMEALTIMEKAKITSLPVVDGEKKVIGFLHLHDILRSRIE